MEPANNQLLQVHKLKVPTSAELHARDPGGTKSWVEQELP